MHVLAHHCGTHLALKVAGATACLLCCLSRMRCCQSAQGPRGASHHLATRANPKLSCCRRRSSSSHARPQQQQSALREQQAQAQVDAHSANLEAKASAEEAKLAGEAAEHLPVCFIQSLLRRFRTLTSVVWLRG